jgi:hypothetical protein
MFIVMSFRVGRRWHIDLIFKSCMCWSSPWMPTLWFSDHLKNNLSIRKSKAIDISSGKCHFSNQLTNPWCSCWFQQWYMTPQPVPVPLYWWLLDRQRLSVIESQFRFKIMLGIELDYWKRKSFAYWACEFASNTGIIFCNKLSKCRVRPTIDVGQNRY